MARLKPAPKKLTYFFFMTSLGGAMGGAFVTFAAPFMFRGFFEYHVSLVLAWVLAIAFFLIADIDTPRHGVIRVVPENLISLGQSLQTR